MHSQLQAEREKIKLVVTLNKHRIWMEKQAWGSLFIYVLLNLDQGNKNLWIQMATMIK